MSTTHMFVWKPIFPAKRDGKYITSTIGIKPPNEEDVAKRGGNVLSYYMDLGHTRELVVPIMSPLCIATDYTPELQNLITQNATLGGNSITTFGENIRKLNMNLQIYKKGTTWINYTAALEAIARMSGNPRFGGNLYLYGFDRVEESLGRKYKVVIEKIVPNHKSERNGFISMDVAMLIKHDYSLKINNNVENWGKL